MAALIALGLALVHFGGGNEKKISKDEALAIARPRIDFSPNGHQIRYLRRGIPSHGFWVVTYYIRNEAGKYKRVTVVFVDASTGEVTEVRRTA
jgi:Peptidase propeptide and YPEB domain